MSLLTPAALGVLKARRAGLLSGMGLPCLPLRCWLGIVVVQGKFECADHGRCSGGLVAGPDLAMAASTNLHAAF